MPTVLTAAGAPPVPDLPGRALQPLFAPGLAPWRTHLFAEFHTHAAAPNYFPQRSVRTERFKLIENLLPGEVHPDFDLTLGKLTKEAERRAGNGALDLRAAIAAAPSAVRDAYALTRQPPRFELYDLQADPFEFRNLATQPEHAATLEALQRQLTEWRRETADPLLNETNLRRLTTEVRAVSSKSAGKELQWGYPDYFFGREPAAPTPAPAAKKKKKRRP
jgi:N-sulfoglucosamine sulfohydrolase